MNLGIGILIFIGVVAFVYVVLFIRYKLAYDEERYELEAELSAARAAGDREAEHLIQTKRVELSLYGPTDLRRKK